MEQHFSLKEAARRYNEYRPKVHDIVLTWIKDNSPIQHFKNGIDVACGTGDSTVPLTQICDSVVGIDSSPEMLKHAKQKGLNVKQASYDEIEPSNHYDFINTGMAYHWFDPIKALNTYKAASIDRAIWIIYTFSFAGHESNDEFNNWIQNRYVVDYPTPPRNKTSAVIPRDDDQINLIKEDKGYVPIQFDYDQLIGYLSTQSNIEVAVKAGKEYESICKDLKEQLSSIDISGNFKYNYSYEIHQYTP